jgi:hypothetical protein
VGHVIDVVEGRGDGESIGRRHTGSNAITSRSTIPDAKN